MAAPAESTAASPVAVDRTRRRRLRRALTVVRIALDALGFAVAWALAWALRSEFGDRPLNPASVYVLSLPAIVAGGVLVAASVGSYTAQAARAPLEEATKVLRVCGGALLVAMSMGFLFKSFDISRAVVLLYFVLALLTIPAARAFAGFLERRFVKLGLLGTRVLIVGAGPTGIRALQKVHDHPEVGYRVIGFLDDGDSSGVAARIGRTPLLGPVAMLRDVIEKEQVDEVILALPEADSEHLMGVLMQIDDLPVRVRVVADLFGVLSRDTHIDLIDDVPIYDLVGTKDSWFYRTAKRGFDLAVGLAAGVVFLVTLPFIALAIKLDDPGPVFFVHERIGQGGRAFRMWKYRSMRTSSEVYAVAPKAGTDARITRVGTFLRKTSLDELPQVINVIRGDMSIVGPRPEMPFIVAGYNEWQKKRLEVPPGLTGLWQILGRKDLPLHENLEYDFYYIKNRSLLLDIVIVLKTIPAALLGRGAY